MPDLKFSVGKIVRTYGDPPVDHDAGTCTDITVSYDGSPVEFRGGDERYPLEIKLGDQTLTVTATSSDYSATDPLSGEKETLKLQAGAHGGGIVIEITNMVLVSAEVSSSQDGFVTTALEWHKVKD